MALVADRIKQECWDAMEAPARFLVALKSGQELCSFPLRERPDLKQVVDKVTARPRVPPRRE